jgi:hypothetical protein
MKRQWWVLDLESATKSEDASLRLLMESKLKLTLLHGRKRLVNGKRDVKV